MDENASFSLSTVSEHFYGHWHYPLCLIGVSLSAVDQMAVWDCVLFGLGISIQNSVNHKNGRIPVSTKLALTQATQTKSTRRLQRKGNISELYLQLLGLNTRLEVSRLVGYVSSSRLYRKFGFHVHFSSRFSLTACLHWPGLPHYITGLRRKLKTDWLCFDN